ncbi:hybrid sensor histidine kinase/response regulator [Malaciobacter molluscorum LMG 25693]|uniref:histidine kinase n=1 Tax=Malaciobacter molluscorum LMG 25693 TaxID=870501 RepID=A0A2G1DJC9_9BACT|nr:hybrid sensor histidine kinase/response regulator [Malaciobacter molluscorum]AXX91598.1 two-component system sensor histidine kinase/response regulator fusion protein [Malaciobacter molluscorum LMG 25693]PHO18607.1 hybrid sensor histidine kinase/response regulator [Malaciobacter molluscorum LMG 25693]
MDKKYTILIIDDKVENLQYLNNILKDENYLIKATTDAQFAIKSAKLSAPDLILLDIKIPHLNGFEVCRIFKDDEKLKDIPIIFISALDDVQSKVKAFEEGGVDYITKPFEKEEVKARIKTQLNLFESKQTNINLLKQQDFFLKKIIHEMNTPLSIISLNIDNLETQIGPKEQFEAIKASSKSLSFIYNDLYYLIKKEKKIEEKKEIELIKFLSSRVMFFDEMANIKNIDINLDIHAEFNIFIDENSLQRVIDNTISNAIKYAEINSQIDIILDINKDEHFIIIKNSGSYIQDTDSIFKAYYQDKSKNIGLGLGLNIVKDICDNNNIEISVKSENNTTSFSYKIDIKDVIKGNL